MESGLSVFGKDEKKKYYIYVEEYVLSYLRRESDSLELSEIYFYGSRHDNGRKLYVYGAGRDREIAAFAGYESLSELVCRLTQAGPVFLVREPDGECRATGFQVFYDNNEAMQNYLLEWTSSTGKRQIAGKSGASETLSASVVFPEEEKKRIPRGAMSMQLCLILVVLVAIVITSADSYDKMEELNRSAREVFFAIENQEAGEMADNRSEDTDSGETVDDRTQDVDFDEAKDDQIGEVTSDRIDSDKTDPPEKPENGMEGDADSAEPADAPARNEDSGGKADDPVQTMDSDAVGDDSPQADSADGKKPMEEKEQEGDGLKSAQETPGQTDGEGTIEENEEENEEALSRSITRYYEVEQGDTLYTISQKIYGDISRVEKICEVNQISDPDKIRYGQRIILP